MQQFVTLHSVPEISKARMYEFKQCMKTLPLKQIIVVFMVQIAVDMRV